MFATLAAIPLAFPYSVGGIMFTVLATIICFATTVYAFTLEFSHNKHGAGFSGLIALLATIALGAQSADGILGRESAVAASRATLADIATEAVRIYPDLPINPEAANLHTTFTCEAHAGYLAVCVYTDPAGHTSTMHLRAYSR